jgi:hypothetical protein
LATSGFGGGLPAGRQVACDNCGLPTTAAGDARDYLICGKTSFMRIFAPLFIVLFFAGASRVQAQSLANTAWKFYVEPLHDTLTMHIGVDTSFSTSSSGEMIVRSLWKQVKDTVRINDLDGMYPCTTGEGVYRVNVDGDYLNFILVTDPCDQRAGALNGIKCKKVGQ